MSNLSTDYDVRLATLKKLGGDMSKKYATIYDVDLAILDKIGQGGGGGEGGSLTPEQEEAIEKLVNANEGVLYTNVIKSLDYYNDFFKVDTCISQLSNEHLTPGEVYFVDCNSSLYKFNYEGLSFDQIAGFTDISTIYPVWKDNSGRYYNYNQQIDIETGKQIKVVDGIDVIQTYGYSITLFRFGNEILNISSSNLKRFNESTQTFEDMNLTSINQFPSPEIIMYYEGDIIAPTYGLRLVKVDDNTYKWESYTTPFETSLPTGYAFDGLDNIHYVEGVGYVFANRNDYQNLYKLVDGHWETLKINSVDGGFSGGNFVSTALIGSLIIGHTSNSITLVNAGNDYKTTDWTTATDKFVDLKSNQEIKGFKNFEIITTGFLNAENINSKYNNLNISASNKLEILTNDSGRIDINTNRLLKKGVDIATLNDTICNPETKYIGPDYKQVQLENDICSSYRNIVVLHNGRIFSFSYSESYEFVGNTWRTVDFGLGFNYIEAYRTFKITSDKVYFVNIDNSNIYEFTGDEFIQKTSDGSSSYGSVIPLGDTLYDYSTSKKLNTTTWEWESVNTINNVAGESTNYKVINGNTYSFYSNVINKYNPETNSFEVIIDSNLQETNFGFINNPNVFTYESNVYFESNEGIFKFNTVNNKVEKTNILYNQGFAYFEYDGKLYTSGNCSTGYTFETKYNKPVIPNNGLDYSLTAKSTNGKVEYSYEGIWSGTQAEWDALPVETQNTIKIALITE